MSGHSKWSTIKRKKGAADAKRGALFGKLSRAMSVAAREGGGGPEMNSALALAVSKAKDANMPNDNIQRAIDKGTGAHGEAETFERITYEGYAPGGVALAFHAWGSRAFARWLGLPRRQRRRALHPRPL